MTAPARILIVDDDPMAATGVSLVLASADDLRVVGARADGDEVPDAIRELRPDVVLCDVRMPRVDGVAVARRLASAPGAPRFLMMTAFDEDGLVLQAIEAGAAGFLLKDEDPHRIVEAVRAVAAGDSAYSPRAARQLTRWVQDSPSLAARRAALAKIELLTDREREFAFAVADGSTDAEIAARFFVAETTVKSTLGAVRAKWGARNRVEIAVTATRSGLA